MTNPTIDIEHDKMTTTIPLGEDVVMILDYASGAWSDSGDPSEDAGKIGEPLKGPTRIHIRVKSPDGYDEIRTKTFGKGIQARLGIREGKSHVVSLLFDPKKWNAQTARQWYTSHKTALATDLMDDVDRSWPSTTFYNDTTSSVTMEPDLLPDPAENYGFTLPDATPTKAFAVFKLLSFNPVVNQRHDTFDEADVDGEAVKSLIGSPIYGNENLTDHFNADGTRGRQVGAVIDVNKIEKDGIYGLAALYKDILEEKYGVDPKTLPSGYSVSMEVKFDSEQTRYQTKGKSPMDRSRAVAEGVAAPLAANDDPKKYTARFLVPIEYHAVALLRRGRNADPTADFLLAAASTKGAIMPENQILWHQQDFDSFVAAAEAYGADLSYKQRKNLDKSDFAYVDDKGEGHLPIHDAAHVRNALARLNQTDIPSSAKKSALRKIMAAAKRFGIDVNKDSQVRKAYSSVQTIGLTNEERIAHAKEMVTKMMGSWDPAKNTWSGPEGRQSPQSGKFGEKSSKPEQGDTVVVSPALGPDGTRNPRKGYQFGQNANTPEKGVQPQGPLVPAGLSNSPLGPQHTRYTSTQDTGREAMLKRMSVGMNPGKDDWSPMASASNPEILVTDDFVIIFTLDDVLYQGTLSFDEEGELGLNDVPAALAYINPLPKEIDMTEAEFKAAIDQAKAEGKTEGAQEAKAASEATSAQSAQAAVEVFKGSDEFKGLLASVITEFKGSDGFKTLLQEAGTKAVEKEKTVRDTVAARMKEIATVYRFKTDEEKAQIETQVASTVEDETGWLRLKSDLLAKAVIALTQATAAASRREIPVTLRTGVERSTVNLLDITSEEAK